MTDTAAEPVKPIEQELAEAKHDLVIAKRDHEENRDELEGHLQKRRDELFESEQTVASLQGELRASRGTATAFSEKIRSLNIDIFQMRNKNGELKDELKDAHSRIKTQGRLHTVDRAALLRSKSKVMKENTGLRAQNSRLNAAVIRQALELTDEKEAGEHRAAELQTLHRDHEELLGRENGSPDSH